MFQCFSPCTAIGTLLGRDHREHGARLRGLGSSSERQDQMLNTLLDGIPGALDPLPPDMAVHCAEVVAACLQNWRFFYGVS